MGIELFSICLTALEKRKQQEQLRLLKEQEKLQRHEQMRMERELRAQQILEVRYFTYTLYICFFVSLYECLGAHMSKIIDFTSQIYVLTYSTIL